MNKKLYYLDWIRVIAVVGVLYGHLVSVATYAASLPTVISANNEMNLPWIPENTHILYKLDVFMGKVFHTSTAAVGVVLFFWLAGFLTAMTREKYSGKEFIIKRAIRIFPGLIISVILVGGLAYFSQGIIYPIHWYFSNATMLFPFLSCAAIIGVLWTLGVEFIFNIITIHISKFTFRTILVVDLLIALFCIYHKTNYVETASLNYIVYFVKYIPIIFVGATIYNASILDNRAQAIGRILCTFIFSYFILYIVINGVHTSGEVADVYLSLGTYFWASVIWLLLTFLDYKKVKIIVVRNKIIDWIAETSYLIYLLQLNVGLLSMYYVKIYITSNAYIIVASGLVCTFLVATFLHYYAEQKIQAVLDIWHRKWKNSSCKEG